MAAGLPDSDIKSLEYLVGSVQPDGCQHGGAGIPGCLTVAYATSERLTARCTTDSRPTGEAGVVRSSLVRQEG
jgi:hypothetical protein